MTLMVNNNPYNLEFFIWASFDRPEEKEVAFLFQKMDEAGLKYRPDITAIQLFQEMGGRRFNSVGLLDEESVDQAFFGGSLFFFAEERDLAEKGFYRTPFGKEKKIFISYSHKNQEDLEQLIPFLNAADLSIWFDKYSIEAGQFLTDEIQKGILESKAALLWITEEYLNSKWCKMELRTFIAKLVQEEIKVYVILDREEHRRELPLFLQDLKYICRENTAVERVAAELIPLLNKI